MASASTPTTPRPMDLDEIKKQYPLHICVWNNDFEGLKKELTNELPVEEIEKKDVRGRSALMLAVTLGHLEISRFLMEKGANVNTENKQGWTVVQEAVATGDPELVQLVLERRDYQRYSSRVGGVPELLHKLKEAPDFYVEMKWEFTSWLPLISRMCPSDTYKIYKQGSKVRIDTTLLGFDQNRWQRGNTTFIFQGQSDLAKIMEVDHEAQQVFVEQMKMISESELHVLQPSQETITARLTTPIVTTYVDVDKISFERNKTGIWGWRQDKSEEVGGYSCKVFGASNVQLVTKTRTEHLSDAEKAANKGSKSPFQSFLQSVPVETEERSVSPSEEHVHAGNPCHITLEEYFNGLVDLGNRDIGRPKDITSKIQKFKATLWLCEDYPLSLPEQIMPIVDLMAISSSHFAKLKNFIQMQLPAGFPVKIEIPLFHVLNARITFGNIFALETPVNGVKSLDDNGKTLCSIEDSCFEPPASYEMLGADSRRQISLDEDDDMLQYAIQQSLLQSGTEQDQVDIWEALQVQRPNTPCFLNDDDEEKQLQRAIQASLLGDRVTGNEATDDGSPPTLHRSPSNDDDDDEEEEDADLIKAIVLSQQEQVQRDRENQMEQEMLELALKLSMDEK